MVKWFWPHRYSLNTSYKQKQEMNNARLPEVLAMHEHLENFESYDLLIFMNVRFQ